MLPGIVLSGGKSSRMGRPKALLPVNANGETFLDRVTRTLLDGGVDHVVVVVGADAEVIRANAREAPRVQIVTNPEYEQGQLTSLLAGLQRIDDPAVTGVLVTLIDVPLISADTVGVLIAAHHRTQGAPIVRPVSNGRHGHPVIFARSLFDELRRADPRKGGAKSVVHAHAADIIEIPVADEGAFVDIDTRADYERWIGRFPD
jgi:CTP:molybdopterin cytidylyltransferase MocA